MTESQLFHLLGWAGMACWGVCFWWMHRISKRQSAVLDELHAMTRRIEKFSKAEHDLIREVHPAVGDIKDAVDNIENDVKRRK